MPWILFGVGGIILFFTEGLGKMSDNPSYDLLFKEKAKKYGLDWKMLKAIAIIESSIGQAIKDKALENAPDSFDGLSAGLMQMTLRTAKDYDPAATWLKLKDPEYSVELASRHIRILKALATSYPTRSTEFIVKSYNQGQGNTKKEFTNLISGYAENYWKKYQSAYNKL